MVVSIQRLVAYLVIVGVVVCTPAAMLLAQSPDLGWFKTVLWVLAGIVDLLIPILISLSFVVFVWGLVLFIGRSGSQQAVEEGKRKMIWGVLVLFVIVSVWGIIALLKTMTDTDVAGMGSVTSPGIPVQP